MENGFFTKEVVQELMQDTQYPACVNACIRVINTFLYHPGDVKSISPTHYDIKCNDDDLDLHEVFEFWWVEGDEEFILVSKDIGDGTLVIWTGTDDDAEEILSDWAVRECEAGYDCGGSEL